MSEIWIKVVIGFLKALSCVYDVVALIPYYYICKPHYKVQQSQRIKAKPVSDIPGEPLRSVDCPGDLTTTLFPESKCVTVDNLFNRAVQFYGPNKCLGTREVLSVEDELQPDGRFFKKLIKGEYQWQTYSEVFERVKNLGRGLLALGQKPKDRILIFAETSADWIIAAQSAFMYNFPVVTLYATLGPAALAHGINESEVSIIITSTGLLPILKKIKDQIPKVTHLIYSVEQKKVSSDGFPSNIRVISNVEVEMLGQKQENSNLTYVKPTKSDVAVIMYTSGSTGLPKGVVMSHGNLMSGMSGQCQRIPGLGNSDTYIGYLPLAHVLELTAELSCMAHGTAIGYSSALTLTDQSSKIKRGSKGDATLLKPTLMASVPLVMDRLYKGVWDKVNSEGKFTRALFEFAYDYKGRRLNDGYDTPIFNRFLFKKIRQILGGEVRMMLCGGAPLSAATQKFMNICFCCPVGQGYGLTETCGAGTITEVTDLSTGRVGAPLVCSEIRLCDWPEGNYTTHDKPNPRGEILIGGGNVAVGYFKNDEKTKENFITINGFRYFCTGDIGEFERDGCLKIIDRRKDLVKLQAGEYISLGKVETVLKMSSLVEQICVYANSLKSYCVCLVVPNQKNLNKLADDIGLKGQDNYNQLCKNQQLRNTFIKQLLEFGIKSQLDKYEIPQKVSLCPESWTPDSGLVTDAFKLKRKNLEEHFSEEIKEMYGN